MKRKILVSGGKGFIGNALVERLGKNNTVESFDMVDSQDLLNDKQVNEAVARNDIVFHLAAVADLNWARIHPKETLDINIKGTWNIAHACCKEKKPIFYASTCCVFGPQEIHPVDEKALPNPNEIYACSKMAGEHVILGLHHSFGLPYNMMRFATIYGPGVRPALATHIFMGQALRGEPITVHGDGSQTRTLTYIDDLVEAMITLYESGKMNEVWAMTATEEISAIAMAYDIKWLCKSDSEIIYIPQRIGQTMRESISNAKMKSIGWRTKVTWQEGLELMYAWFLKTNQIKNIYDLSSRERVDIPRKGNKVWDTLPEAEKHKQELENQGYWVTIQHMSAEDNFSKIVRYNVIWVLEQKNNPNLPDGYTNIKGEHETIYPDE